MNEKQSLELLIKGVEKAQASGVYTLQEANHLAIAASRTQARIAELAQFEQEGKAQKADPDKGKNN